MSLREKSFWANIFRISFQSFCSILYILAKNADIKCPLLCATHIENKFAAFFHLAPCFSFYIFYLPYSFRQMFWVANAAYKTLQLSDVKQQLFFSQICCLSWHLNRTNFFSVPLYMSWGSLKPVVWNHLTSHLLTCQCLG